MELVIDMGAPTQIGKVTVGALENQGSGIFFPVQVQVLLSEDGESFKSTGMLKREYAANIGSELKDFVIEMDGQSAQYIKVVATNLGAPPNGGGSWMFIDEVVVE
jgi:hexosaminidase